MNEIFIRRRIHEITEGHKHKLGEYRVYRSIHNSSAPQNWAKGAWRGKSWDLEAGVLIYENVRVGQTASAEGVKLRLLKARSPSRLGGLGERRKLPSGVWGGAPETEAILSISCQNWVHFGIL